MMLGLRFTTLLGIFVILAFDLGCSGGGSGGSSGGSSVSAGGSAMLAAKTKVTAAATSPGGVVPLGMAKPRNDEIHTSSVLTDWGSNGFLPDPRSNGNASTCTHTASVDVKTKMRINYSPNAEHCNGGPVSALGKMKDALSLACMLAAVMPEATSADLATSGTTTISAAAVASAATSCGVNATITADIVTAAAITLTDLVDKTTYDRNVDFALTITGMGSLTMHALIRYSATEANLAYGMAGSPERTIVNYNLTTQVLKGEYIDGTMDVGSSLYKYDLWRVYYDATNDVARILEDETMYTDTAANAGTAKIRVVYLSTAKPATPNQDMAFSVDLWATVASGFGWPYTAANAYALSGCVDVATGAMPAALPAGDFTCGLLGAAGTFASKDYTTFNKGAQTWTLVNTANWGIPSLVTPPNLASWTIDTMLTTAP